MSALITAHRMTAALVAVLSVPLASEIAKASWDVNGNPAVIQPEIQWPSSVVLDSNGGVIVFWVSDPTGPAHVYAQRFDADGVPQWPTNGVLVTNITRSQHEPSAVSDGVGGAILTYVETSVSDDIYAQRIDANGVPMWGSGRAICTESGHQEYPRIISDGRSGITDTPGAIIVWQDGRPGTDGPDIYAQAISADGDVQWSNQGVAVCTANGVQEYAAMVTDGAGFFSGPKGAIIAWQDSRNGAPDIYAQRLSSSGLPQWAPDGEVVCDAVNWQRLPFITFVGGGNAIIAWEDLRSDAAGDIWAQRVGPAGSWPANGVPVCRAADWQVSVELTTDGTGGAILTWQDHRGGGNQGDVFAQRLDAFGTALWQTDGINASMPSGEQMDPSIAPGSDGGAIVVWRDDRGSIGIYAQRLSIDGTRLWGPTDVPLRELPTSAWRPIAVPDGAGGVYAAWTDGRNGDDDVYVQRAVDIATDVSISQARPAEFEMLGAWPNPMTHASAVRFALPQGAPISAGVFGAEGRLVRTLARDRLYAAGVSELLWDGNDSHGARVPAGVYFVKVDAGPRSATSRVVVVR
jgi:FlgD Ig-like domain